MPTIDRIDGMDGAMIVTLVIIAAPEVIVTWRHQGQWWRRALLNGLHDDHCHRKPILLLYLPARKNLLKSPTFRRRYCLSSCRIRPAKFSNGKAPRTI
jgi:hypothetical protein